MSLECGEKPRENSRLWLPPTLTACLSTHVFNAKLHLIGPLVVCHNHAFLYDSLQFINRVTSTWLVALVKFRSLMLALRIQRPRDRRFKGNNFVFQDLYIDIILLYYINIFHFKIQWECTLLLVILIQKKSHILIFRSAVQRHFCIILQENGQNLY